MGASLTNIFLIYTSESIVRVFFITAATFAAISIYRVHDHHAHLTPHGQLHDDGIVRHHHRRAGQHVYRKFGVAVRHQHHRRHRVHRLTAYDTQRIKATYVQYAYAEGPDGAAKRSVYNALSLYLNFINLFMLLLQLLGNRNNS